MPEFHDEVDQDSIAKALTPDACQSTDRSQLNNSPNDNICGSEQLPTTYRDVGRASKDKQRMSGKLAKSKNKRMNSIDCRTVVIKRDATKRIFINKVPPVLTVHLKRFSQDTRGRLSKLNGCVNFQVVLDLSPHMDPRYVKFIYFYSGLSIHFHYVILFSWITFIDWRQVIDALKLYSLLSFMSFNQESRHMDILFRCCSFKFSKL